MNIVDGIILTTDASSVRALLSLFAEALESFLSCEATLLLSFDVCRGIRGASRRLLGGNFISIRVVVYVDFVPGTDLASLSEWVLLIRMFVTREHGS